MTRNVIVIEEKNIATFYITYTYIINIFTILFFSVVFLMFYETNLLTMLVPECILT